MSRPLGTYTAEQPPALWRILDLFFTLFLGSMVLIGSSAFYYYGQTLEQQIKQTQEEVSQVQAELKQCETAAQFIRKIRAKDKALDEKLKRAYKLKRRKR